MIYIQNGIIQLVQKVTNLDKLFLGNPLERLAKAGYLLDVEFSKREIRITYNRSASKYTTIPFGQTRLTDFHEGDPHGQNSSKFSHAA